MGSERYSKKLFDYIAKVSEDLDNSQGEVDASLQKLFAAMLNKLVQKNNRIAASVENLRAIREIGAIVGKAISSPANKESIKSLTKSFDYIGKVQEEYFKTISNKFKPSQILAEIKKQSIDTTIQGLIGAGMASSLESEVKNILTQNITSGATISNLSKQLQDHLTANGGAYKKHASQIVTDSLNQFSAQYSQLATGDLGLDWFMYVGSNIETTRDFCEHLTAKKYVHRSEIPTIVHGDIDGYQVELNPKTDLPKGMVPGTTPFNFPVYRGGYNCGHQLIPVSELAVPNVIKKGRSLRPAVLELMKMGQAAGPEVDKVGKELAKKYNAAVTPVNYKGFASMTRKAVNEYNGNVFRIKDAARNTIIAPDDEIENILKGFEESAFSSIKIKRQRNDPLGYTGNLINYKAKNGLMVETQVNTPEMIYAKDVYAKELLGESEYNRIKKNTGLPSGLGHLFYEEYRLLKGNDPAVVKRKMELQAESQKYYSNFAPKKVGP